MADKTKICKHCQTEIDAKAKVCPNCGKSQKSVGCGCLTAIAVFILVAGAAGSGGNSNRNSNDTSSTLDRSNISTTAITETEEETTEIPETENITDTQSETEEVAIEETPVELEQETEAIPETEGVSEVDNANPEMSKEDIANLLDSTLQITMGDTINSNVTYDNNEEAYVVTIWQDGFASIVSTVIESGTNRENWQSVVDSYVALSNSLKNMVDTAESDADSKVVVAILNDQNLENSLLTIENGVVTYDIVASQS